MTEDTLVQVNVEKKCKQINRRSIIQTEIKPIKKTRN